MFFTLLCIAYLLRLQSSEMLIRLSSNNDSKDQFMTYKEYNPLETTTHNRQPSIPYYQPEIMDVISLKTTALNVFTHFCTVKPYVIHVKKLVDDALQMMLKVEGPVFLVSNNGDEVVGVINTRQLQGINRTKVVRKEDLHPKEVTFRVKIAKISDFLMLDYAVLKNTLVG